jgi:uncharacterized membrane protein
MGLSTDMSNQIYAFAIDATVTYLSSFTAAAASALGSSATGSKVAEVPEIAKIGESIDTMTTAILAYLTEIRVDPFKFLDWVR